MKIYCNYCVKEQDIIVQLSGPHLKAICSICKSYLKFLNKNERLQLEQEEDSKELAKECWEQESRVEIDEFLDMQEVIDYMKEPNIF